MTESEHSNGEIIRTLDRIEQQVIKTNGRVSALEKWRWLVSGGVVVLGGMSIPNIAAIIKLISG